MTTKITTTIVCDRCHERGIQEPARYSLTGSAVALRDARRRAELLGWRYIHPGYQAKRIDVCPDCAEVFYADRERYPKTVLAASKDGNSRL